MGKSKPLTKDDLIDTLADFYQDFLTPDLDKRFGKIDKRFVDIDKKFDGVNERLDGLEREIKWIKNDIKGLTGELSKVVSKEEFNTLKKRVDRYHPRN